MIVYKNSPSELVIYTMALQSTYPASFVLMLGGIDRIMKSEWILQTYVSGHFSGIRAVANPFQQLTMITMFPAVEALASLPKKRLLSCRSLTERDGLPP